MRKLIYVLLISFLLIVTGIASAEQKMRVVFINPGFPEAENPTGEFWPAVSSFMRAAAEDLSIDLMILYAKRNHVKMVSLAKEVVSRKNPPDYLIVVNEKLSAEQMVIDADSAGVKVLVMLNGFEGDQLGRMGKPREKFPRWIGSLIPDNRYAGYIMAKQLIDHAMVKGVVSADGYLHLLGLSGDYITQASVERVEGLRTAVSEYNNVVLRQIIPCDWSRDVARIKTVSALQRYHHIDAVWAANDPIALGAIEGAVASGKTPGKDIFFAGLNWDVSGLDKVKSGEMVTSIGGHFMTGGWALVMLYDYHHQRDFAEEGTRLKYQIFGALHQDNIDQFLHHYGDRNWMRMDFTRYSKALNPLLHHYSFDAESLFSH